MKEINSAWQIGTVTIPGRVGLAPMAGVSDVSFRVLAKEQGAALLCTEMVSAMGIHYKNENTKDLLVMEPGESPVSMQIFGSDPAIMAEAATVVADAGADIVDINMGCPVKKVVSSGDGSAMMKDPVLAAQVAKACVDAVSVPVTVKLRLGWDDDSMNVVEMAKRMEDAGVAAVAVHGRTREQFYMGQANWDYIRQVKEALTIPVLGNGDVTDPLSAERMMKETGCDAVLIGRGAQGNPWVFHQVNHYFATGEILPPPSGVERVTMMMKHFERLCHYKGEAMAAREIRTHAGWYVKGLPEAARWRNTFNTTIGKQGFLDAVRTYRAYLQEKEANG